MYDVSVSFLIWIGNDEEDDGRKKEVVKKLTSCNFLKWTDIENNGFKAD